MRGPSSASRRHLASADRGIAFEKFEESELALVCPDEKTGGEQGNFNTLVSRDSV